MIKECGLDSDVKVWVPSHEHPPDPEMPGLAETVKRNTNPRYMGSSTPNGPNDIIDAWRLWRRLTRPGTGSSTTGSPNDSEDEDEGSPTLCIAT
ncbi:unnamed protein product [Callosobruchus maculatus]|uniref:Uncharacterized protein n=1 Tax=Callosobruchus maculatus TaxID=64391 RepID=A0A653D3L4_CALMS|nr:unnamed protein product [Callosobruchus maculatus]